MVQQKDAHKKQIFAYIIFNLNNSTSLIEQSNKGSKYRGYNLHLSRQNLTTQKPRCLKIKGIYFFLNLRIKITS